MKTKSITKSILALFIAATVFTSCSSNQTVASTKKTVDTKVQQTTAAVSNVANTLSGDDVKFVPGLKSAPQAKFVSVNVIYSSTTDRQLVAEIKSSDNKWLAGGKVNVTKGSGTKTIKLWSKTPVEAGDDYTVGVAIRPVGTTWKENISRDVIKSFSVK